MKKLLLLLCLICFAFAGLGQAKGISILGLEAPKKMSKMPVLTASYSSQGSHLYFIEKNLDRFSDEIRDAVERSTVFPKAIIFIKQANGLVSKHHLTTVYLSTYVTENELESFKVHFQNETINEN